MRHSKKITVSAMLAALGTALLYVSSLLGALDIDLAIASLSAVFIAFAVIEMGNRWAMLVYAVTSALSLLVLPQKYIAAIYILFCGIYPVLKRYFEKLKFLLSWLAKLAYFNAAFTGTLLSAKFIFMIEQYHGVMLVAFFGVGNLAFIVFDLFLTRMIRLYFIKLRKQLRIGRLMK